MSLATPYLQGLYAPRDEHPASTELRVLEGEVPKDLRGCYLRAGSNPAFTPSASYHWFDGDGMVQGVSFEQGAARYQSRYVQTAAYLEERAAGSPLYGGLLDPIPARGPRDKVTANTDLVWHADRLLALWWLGGAPYRLDPETLETLGIESFDGGLGCGVAAHPKVCPTSGEMMCFDFSPYKEPYLEYGVVDQAGRPRHHTTIAVPGPRLFHDIAITERYTLFLDLPLLWDRAAVARGRRAVRFDRALPSRFGILPRHGEGHEIRWFEDDPCYIYHTINAWEDGDEVVLTACRIDDPMPSAPPSPDDPIPRLSFLRLEPYIFEWRFDLVSGAVNRRQLDDVPTEFPRMNDAWLGARSRYAYGPRIAREPTLLFDGLRKLDLEDGSAEEISYGQDRFGDEAVFVPRPAAQNEDDGWLVTLVHDRREGASEVAIWDAREPSAGVVARLALPAPAPIGFHACWVPGD